MFRSLVVKEQQKPAKRKYTKKQRPPPPAVTSPPIPPEPTPPSPPPAAESTGDLSPDRRMDYFSASLLDHEYTAGPGPFGPGGPRGTGAMAPGVFLTSRRPSLSPQNSSSQSGASVAGSASQGAAGVGQGECSHLGSFFGSVVAQYLANSFLMCFPLSAFIQGDAQRKDLQLQNRDSEKF